MNIPQLLMILLAALAGVILPLQAGASNRMAEATQSPILATFMSFLIGTIGFLIYLPLSGTSFRQLSGATAAPWWAWSAGLMGAVYVGSVIFLVPRMGVALTFSVVIAGQMLFSLLMERYGWFGTPIQEISLTKIIGALFLISGVVLMMRKN